MGKKKDLPAMPFYVGDWLKDPVIRILSHEERGIWLDMLCLMWESKERGYLTINGKPFTDDMLARALSLVNHELTSRLTYFEELALFSRRETDKAIYSRKILQIVELSEKRKNAGKQGGNPNLLNQELTKKQARGLLVGYPNAETETENEYINNIPPKLNFPEFIRSWSDWQQHRKEIKKKLTPLSVQKQFNFLIKQDDPVEVIDAAILSGWTGLWKQNGKTMKQEIKL